MFTEGSCSSFTKEVHYVVELSGPNGPKGSEEREAGEVTPVISEQLSMDLGDVRREIPWQGRSPRSLTRVARGASCVVDKSSIHCPSREAERFDADPAQLTLFLQGSPPNGT